MAISCTFIHYCIFDIESGDLFEIVCTISKMILSFVFSPPAINPHIELYVVSFHVSICGKLTRTTAVFDTVLYYASDVQLAF